MTLGIILPILLITLSSILIYRARTRPPKPAPDPAAEPEAEREYALPGPVHQPGTVRRATGQPQTFYGWVQSSNAEAGVGHERFASLEEGPGPVIRREVPAGHERHAYASLENGPGPEIEDSAASGLAVSKARKDSIGGSSLRDAVLSASEQKEEAKSKEIVLEEVKIPAKKAEERSVLRGYSGAWP